MGDQYSLADKREHLLHYLEDKGAKLNDMQWVIWFILMTCYLINFRKYTSEKTKNDLNKYTNYFKHIFQSKVTQNIHKMMHYLLYEGEYPK